MTGAAGRPTKNNLGPLRPPRPTKQEDPTRRKCHGLSRSNSLALVVVFAIEFFARYAIEGFTVFGGAAYLTPMASWGWRLALGELDVGLLAKKSL